MTDLIMRTKITVPPLRSNLVTRYRLLEKLNEGLSAGNKITLISAAAGSGKTTLLSDWARVVNRPTAWLSIDPEDNDFYRFWDHVIASMQTMQNSIGMTAQAALRSAQNISPHALIASITNDVIQQKTPFLLALDDYQLIHAESIHESINSLAKYLPSQMHLAIASREEPPLDIPRWRADSSLTEIQTYDLAFTELEIESLMNEIMDLNLSMDDLRVLGDRTEGWAVGLQLAMLSLQKLSLMEKSTFIKKFAGDDRFIVDYLAEVVLRNQPDHILSFLLKTSVLEKFSPSLCNDVLGRTDSHTIIKQLEDANLFLVSLDNQRNWFRYHHLFADLLRKRLIQQTKMAKIDEIFLRASRWFEEEGFFSEAVSYAMKLRDYGYVANLLEQNILQTFYRSETRLVDGWLKALPKNELMTRPLLSAVYASCIMLNHYQTLRNPEIKALIEEWLCYAEDGLSKETHFRQNTYNLTRHYIDKVRVYLANFLEEDISIITDMTFKALGRLPSDMKMFRSAFMHNLGSAYQRIGNIPAAMDAFYQARQLGEISGDLFNLSSSVDYLAQLTLDCGNLSKASDICLNGLASISQLSKGQPVPYTGRINITLGRIYAEWCRFDEAIDTIMDGIELLSLTSGEAEQQIGRIELAYIKQALGENAHSFDELNEAKRIYPYATEIIEAHWARISLLAADSEISFFDNALKWLYTLDKQSNLDSESNNFIGLNRVRVMIAKYRFEHSNDISDIPWLSDYLNQELNLAQIRNLPRRELEIFLLKAQLAQIQNDTERAVESIQNALKIGETAGYLRAFVDEGIHMVGLLRLAASQKIYSNYITTLLSVFDRLSKENNIKKAPNELALNEPLSLREFEVLKLMAGGASNPDIAEKLYISVSTVKTHVTHIFDKLGASTRTQAIVRARELKLVE